MKIISGGRQSGKTALLVKQFLEAKKAGQDGRFVVFSIAAKGQLLREYGPAGLEKTDIINAEGAVKGHDLQGHDWPPLYWDDIDVALQHLTGGSRIQALTATSHQEHLNHAELARSEEGHRRRHEQLHHHLDELVADYITHTEGLPSRTSLLEFMAWSHRQTVKPTGEVTP